MAASSSSSSSASKSSMNYDSIKYVHFLRHAQGTHNVNRDYRAIRNLDARITKKGREQCRQLATEIERAGGGATAAATTADSEADSVPAATPTPLVGNDLTANVATAPNDDANKKNAVVSSSPLHTLYHKTQLIVTSPLTRCVQTALKSFKPLLTEHKAGRHQRRRRHPIPPPVLAHESIRETVNFNCDRRRPISELQAEFKGRVDFSLCVGAAAAAAAVTATATAGVSSTSSCGDGGDTSTTSPSPSSSSDSFSSSWSDDDDTIWAAYEERLGSHVLYTGHRESAELHVVAQRGRDFFQWLRQRPEEHVVICSHAAFMRCLWNFGQDPLPSQSSQEQRQQQPPEQLSPQPHSDKDDGDNKHQVNGGLDGTTVRGGSGSEGDSVSITSLAAQQLRAVTRVEQTLDTRHGDQAVNVPIVQFCGGSGEDDDADFEASMRKSYDNCELRSMILAFVRT